MIETASITARVCAFIRAYHTAQFEAPVFRDTLAGRLLGRAACEEMARHFAGGSSYFCPGFHGPAEAALQQVVHGCLAPTPLARAAFAESALEAAAALGCRQYLLLGAGYDTFAWRQPAWARNLTFFELDRQALLTEKASLGRRAELRDPDNLYRVPVDLAAPEGLRGLWAHRAFDSRKISFCSLLGLCYYLPETSFRNLVLQLARHLPRGSALAFDFPGPEGGRHAALAAGAGETMHKGYRPREMEALLAECGFLIYEQMEPREIAERYFAPFNRRYPDCPLEAERGVRLCLAVRQESAAVPVIAGTAAGIR